jgi:uncharacterized protein YdaU (DUF1376 family)
MSDEACTLMTKEEFGCHVWLLLHAWLEGSIPSEPVKIARILKVSSQTFRKVWPAIAPCWAEEDLRLKNRRQEAERVKQTERAQAQSVKGTKGGKVPRINKTEKPRLSSGLTGHEAEPKPWVSLPSPSAVSSSKGNDDEATRQGSEILSLVEKLAKKQNRDPEEVLAEHCPKKRWMRPADMYPGTRVNVLLSLRAKWLELNPPKPVSEWTPEELEAERVRVMGR